MSAQAIDELGSLIVEPDHRKVPRAFSKGSPHYKLCESRTLSIGAKLTSSRSFLRWVGGKQNLVCHLAKHLPKDIHNFIYIEPFAGAANLFFALRPKSAQISDLNPHLIDCYRSVRDKPEQVASYLSSHKANDCEHYYYKIREIYNKSKPSAAQSARFIYLNRTCFNGVFRVNTRGAYNVPYGHKSSPIIPTAKDLKQASETLKIATLTHADYRTTLSSVGEGQFVYIDPPYPPLNSTAYFTHYTANRFGLRDQEDLADSILGLHKRGALFLMSNASLPTIRALYKQFNIISLTVARTVSCKGTRQSVGELVITNY